MDEYYVYYLIDPRSGLPFYIGKGKNDRCLAHLRKSGGGENKFKDRVIAKIRHCDMEPEIKKVAENLNEVAAYDMEYKLIKKYGRRNLDKNGILTNICIDCRPPSALGRKLSEEHKEKLRNRKLTPEHIEAIRASKIGKPRSPEVIEKIKKSKQNISQETRDKIRVARLGTRASEKTKLKMSRTRKGKYTGKDNPMYGKTRSPEFREKMSKRMSGNNNPMYGKTHSPEAREKIKQAALKRVRKH